MRSIILTLTLLFASLNAPAQVGITDQSSSSTQWKSIENEFVKVIYPETFKSRAVYVANLIEHYSAVVGLSWDIKKPKKVTLIIRDEMAQPNGFVTRAPRRTEWYGSSVYTPIVGSTEWYQTLSIHEYRHVQQFDAFETNTVKFFNIILGDLGISLADVMATKSWMKEGDAVYAESKYTDAGRGRSPRFLARLKAILLGRETPTYDQFISGSYQDSLVNQYVYGYVLISRAYQKFGDDFWDKMNVLLTNGPHPWRLESAFKEISGQSFQEFYYETFEELRKSWAKDAFPGLEKTDYAVNTNPKQIGADLYYVHHDMNSQPALYKNLGEAKTKITEIPYSEDLTRLDYSDSHAVYSEFMPHPRWGFKGYSDLVLVDLKKGSKKYITSSMRLFNPRFTSSGKTILATEYLTDQTWQITELNLSGDKIRSLKLPGLTLVEAVQIEQDKLLVLALNSTGYKSLIIAQFVSDKFTTVLSASRNNLFSLQSNGAGEALFEAQYKGATEVMKLSLNDLSIAQCTHSKISSYAPTFAGGEFNYSEQFPYGNRLQKASLKDCKPLAKTELVDFRYLGENPNDAYNKFPQVSFPEQASLFTKNSEQYKEQDYSGFDARAFKPHSWSFFAARGFGLAVQTDNYLRDFGTNIALGSDGEENTPYTHIEIDFKRYWPVVSLLGDIRNRKVDVMNTDPEQDLTWREGSYGLGLLLPYEFKNHMYSGLAALTYSAEVLRTESYRLDDISVAASGTSQYVKQSVGFKLQYAKQAKPRSILSPWSVSLSANYEDASRMSSESVAGSYRVNGSLDVTTPGFFRNNSILLSASGQQNAEGMNRYVFPTPILDPVGYVYSRGFDYKTSDQFVKISANYMFPIAYPDWNFGTWIYVNRVYANLFVDNTKYMALDVPYNLKSSGTELILQSVFFRFIPLNWGVRYIHETDPDKDDVEMYVGTRLTLF